MRVAIVGAGISGLAAAYYLHRKHEVFVFEKEHWIGGHACTVEVTDSKGATLPVDVGFLVYNEKTYPLFSDLLRAIQAPTRPSNMSFSVRCQSCKVEYASHGLRAIFGGSLFQGFPRQQLSLLREILRFNKLARRELSQPAPQATLETFLAKHRFSRHFFRHYLSPMTAAIWSAPPQSTQNFPLELLLRFLHNHGLLGLYGQPQWRTIRGGSREYVRRLVAPFADRVWVRTPVQAILRKADGVELRLESDTVRVDSVVLAVHSDQALALLGEAASNAEREALSAIRYQDNEIALHMDTRLLPQDPSLWASWNYHVDDCSDPSQPLTMTYCINHLQHLPTTTPFCVSVNSRQQIRPEQILRQWLFHHPQYNPQVPRAQDTLRKLNGTRNTYYCGAYLGYGFHEDGVRSAFEVAQAIDQAQVAA